MTFRMFVNTSAVKFTPVGNEAVADALHFGQAGGAQQPVLAGVEGQQQVAHAVGVVDGLAEHGALLLLHTLLLILFTQGGPQARLLRRQLQSADQLGPFCVVFILLTDRDKGTDIVKDQWLGTE